MKSNRKAERRERREFNAEFKAEAVRLADVPLEDVLATCEALVVPRGRAKRLTLTLRSRRALIPRRFSSSCSTCSATPSGSPELSCGARRNRRPDVRAPCQLALYSAAAARIFSTPARRIIRPPVSHQAPRSSSCPRARARSTRSARNRSSLGIDGSTGTGDR